MMFRKTYRMVVATMVAVFLVLSLGLLSSCTLLTQSGVKPVASTPPAVDQVRLREHVEVLTAAIYPRSHDRVPVLDVAADYIAGQWRDMGLEVIEQPFEVDGRTYRNLIVRMGPQEGPVTVVGAHYDSFGIDDPAAVDDYVRLLATHTPGADDNASGVAGLLELSRLLAADPPVRAIELVAYTLEEPPYFRTAQMGSAVHARALRESGRPVELMIALEMIGYFDDSKRSQRYPSALLKCCYPDTGDFIAITGRFADRKAVRRIKASMLGASDLRVHSITAPASLMQGLDFSDHRNYWAEGFNAVMVTDTAFFRNPHYHQPTDTADTLDYRRMAQVVQGVYAALRHTP